MDIEARVVKCINEYVEVFGVQTKFVAVSFPTILCELKEAASRANSIRPTDSLGRAWRFDRLNAFGDCINFSLCYSRVEPWKPNDPYGTHAARFSTLALDDVDTAVERFMAETNGEPDHKATLLALAVMPLLFGDRVKTLVRDILVAGIRQHCRPRHVAAAMQTLRADFGDEWEGVGAMVTAMKVIELMDGD